MFGGSITWLWAVWAAVTLCFAVLVVWKSLAGFREEDVVILNPAEAKQASEQQQLIAKVQRLGRWAKAFGFTSLGILVVAGGMWLYNGLSALQSGQSPR